MLVDDGFSVLDTDCGIIGERKAVNEVKVVKVPIGQIFPNPVRPYCMSNQLYNQSQKQENFKFFINFT